IWPPGYSALISFTSLILHTDVWLSSKVVNIFALLGTLYVFHYFFKTRLIIVPFFFASSLNLYSHSLAESSMILFFSLGILFSYKYLRARNTTYLYLLAITVVCSFFTRYIGLSLYSLFILIGYKGYKQKADLKALLAPSLLSIVVPA